MKLSTGASTRSKIVALVLLGVFVPLTAWSITLSNYFNESTVVSSAEQFESDTSNNVDGVQITPNAELVVVKQVVNDNGGNATVTDFSVTTDAGTLVFDTVDVDDTTTTYTANTIYLPPDSYSLTESNINGYTEGSWSCTDGTVDDDTFDEGQVTLEAGDQAVCTIINNDVAPSLTLTKYLTKNNGGEKEIEDFKISIDGAQVDSGEPNFVAANTNILISELVLDGYAAGDWNCSDSTGLSSGLPTEGDAAGVTIMLAEGAIVNCEITNDDIAPLLTLTKFVNNDNGGDKEIEDFVISIDGEEVDNGLPNTVLANESITISELEFASYEEGTWECEDANEITTVLPSAGLATGTDLTLLPGSDVTCSITNNALGVDLSIAKSVDDSTPNIGQTITFSLDITNAGPDTATNVSVSDPVPVGFSYVDGSITGGDSSNDDNAVTGLSWTLDSVPANTTVTLTFQATVNAP